MVTPGIPNSVWRCNLEIIGLNLKSKTGLSNRIYCNGRLWFLHVPDLSRQVLLFFSLVVVPSVFEIPHQEIDQSLKAKPFKNLCSGTWAKRAVSKCRSHFDSNKWSERHLKSELCIPNSCVTSHKWLNLSVPQCLLSKLGMTVFLQVNCGNQWVPILGT